MTLESVSTLAEVRRRWQEVADPELVDWLHGRDPGATSARNEQAFAGVELRQRALVDMSRVSLQCTVLSQPVSMPILLAPAGGQHRAHPEGELASARAAGRAGTILVCSSFSTYSIEEIAAEATGPLWFQLYVLKDRAVTAEIINRAERAGCSAIVLTVDVNAQSREWFRMPDEWAKTLGNFKDLNMKVPAFKSLDPSLTWKDLHWLRSLTALPIVVKGIQIAEDARRCIDHGAAAIGVSNHGGFTLPGASPSLHFLPEIVAAVGDGAEVLFDGGIRSGPDVLKSLALGARAVMVGRPMLWGLGLAGQAGVERVLEILRDELENTLVLCGVPDIADATDVWIRVKEAASSLS